MNACELVVNFREYVMNVCDLVMGSCKFVMNVDNCVLNICDVGDCLRKCGEGLGICCEGMQI